MSLVDVRPPEQELAPSGRPTGPGRDRRWPAALLLLAIYGALSLLNATGGFLGSDTAGKVATMEAMAQSGHFDVDVGYWAAEHDPDALLHPMFGTQRVGDAYVQVTTVPMVLAGTPLYEIGGYRLALLLPMLGSVAAALAAARLARERAAEEGADPDSARRTGRTAFWFVGLASPVTIYALDFWEHSIGVAAVLWATVLLRRAWSTVALGPALVAASAAGLVLGAGATMRTELLVFTAALVGWGFVDGFRLGRRVASVAVATAASVGALAALAAGAVLEQLVLDDGIRSGRVAGTAGAAGAEAGVRVREALATALSISPTVEPRGWMFGLIAVSLMVWGTRKLSGGDSLGRPLLLAGAAVVVARFLEGLGFVSGALAAAPMAVAALTAGWSTLSVHGRQIRRVVLSAVLVIFVTQFTGGAIPQWAGRYLLPATALMVVEGVVRLPSLPRLSRITFATLSIAVTLFGVAWLSHRSHSTESFYQAIQDRDDPVVVFEDPFVGREAGAPVIHERWLSAPTEGSLDQAAALISDLGVASWGYVWVFDGEEPGPPPDLDGWVATSTDTVPFIDEISLAVATYEPR